MRIEQVETIIVDLPTVREHRLANQTETKRTILLVRMRNSDGVVGIGEATGLGGLSYREEAPETCKVVIDNFIAPLLLDQRFENAKVAMSVVHKRVKGNSSAKSAVETALLDIQGKILNLPIHQLLGGACRTDLAVGWALATGNADRDLIEAQQMIESHHSAFFKIKVGALPLEQDLERVRTIAQGLGNTARLRVDVNQAWDEVTAKYAIAELQDLGVELVEQPVAKHDFESIKRLSREFRVPIMADESLESAETAFQLAAMRACDVFALKIAKSGGIIPISHTANIADAAGISLYGGTMLESTIGTLASAHAFCSLEHEIKYGTELFGPILLKDDIVFEQPRYENGRIILRDLPGLGAEIDEDKLAFFRRDRSQISVAVNQSARAGV